MLSLGAHVYVRPVQRGPQDGYSGTWFVVGYSGLEDYKLAKHPADDHEVMIHRSRITHLCPTKPCAEVL